MQPIIGICATRQTIPINFSSKQSIVFSPEMYVKIILQFGGIPVIVPILGNEFDATLLASKLDGLLLCGGQDIHPSSYNEECEVQYHESVVGIGEPYKRPILMEPDVARDKNEIRLCDAMINSRKPILGLCRGMQLINIIFGGTLHQEIDESDIKHSYGNDAWVHYHEIIVSENTIAYEIIQKQYYFSSSVHHQGIKDLGKGLISSAHAPDNMVELLEGSDKSLYIIGIQGHPEFTLHNLSKYQGFFSKFIESARNNL